MLRYLSRLMGFRILASDGEIGSVDDFYFDDAQWVIRYLVVQTGSWLEDRRVLLGPEAVSEIDRQHKHIVVALKCDQVSQSPPLDTAKPISRLEESRLRAYYGWPMYWTPGLGPYAATMVLDADPQADRELEERIKESHLRSCREVTGYHVAALDGEMGHVEDLLADEQSWQIRHVVIDTRNWLPGRKVVLPISAAGAFDWAESTLAVERTREQIRTARELDPESLKGQLE